MNIIAMLTTGKTKCVNNQEFKPSGTLFTVPEFPLNLS